MVTLSVCNGLNSTKECDVLRVAGCARLRAVMSTHMVAFLLLTKYRQVSSHPPTLTLTHTGLGSAGHEPAKKPAQARVLLNGLTE